MYVKNATQLGNYTFTPNQDIYYNDITRLEGASLATLKSECDSRSACLGFTTLGYLKNNIPPTSQWHPSFGGDAMGIYLKSTP